MVVEKTNITYLKRLANVLRWNDQEYGKSDNQSSIGKQIGKVKFKTPLVEDELNIFFIESNKAPKLLEGCLIKTTEDEILIGLGISDIEYYFDYGETDAFAALIAHEVGHHLNKHFEDSDKPHFTRFSSLEISDEEEHWLSIAKLLHARECVAEEIEADITACQFVGLLGVLTLHAFNSTAQENLGVRIELTNRMKRLRELQDKGELMKEGTFTLEVDLSLLDIMRSGV